MNTISLRVRRLLLFFVWLFLLLAITLTLIVSFDLVNYRWFNGNGIQVKIVLLLVAAVVLAILQSVMGHLAKYLSTRRVVRTRGQICLNCQYDLSARTRSNDICSECGVYMPRRECVRLWCKLLRSRF